MAKLWVISSAVCISVSLLIGAIQYALCSNTPRLPDCNVRSNEDHVQKEDSKIDTRELLLVSTLDGQVSALDPKDGGKTIWSHSTGSDSLLSSSISQLEMNSNGRMVRLIPSLDGNLYQFNGDSIEPIPVSADSLLRNSFKLGDDIMITGGKESSSFGISLQTGEIRYSCSVGGCDTKGNTLDQNEDILVVRRNNQVVRAITPRTGEERWNFSVGEHKLTFLEKLEADCRGEQSSVAPEDNDAVCEGHCQNKKDKRQEIRVVVPEGIIAAVTGESLDKLLWSYKFKTPIVQVWHLKDGDLSAVDIFDQKMILEDPSTPRHIESSPLLYIGRHQHQLYIQQSNLLKNQIRNVLNRIYHHSSVPVALPRIEWRPYIVTSPSQTPYINHGKESRDLPSRQENWSEKDTTALVLKKHDLINYPFDSGFFLYGMHNVASLVDNETSCAHEDSDGNDSLDQIIIISLWHWWKEVLGISILTSVLVNFLITRHVLKRMKKRLLAENSSSADKSGTLVKPIFDNEEVEERESPEKKTEEKKRVESESEMQDYQSRYATDFEPIQRLGKGGFGVVFEARNKIDDCHYAVKRILLPTHVEAQEKLMREVRALAKLEHSGIVRYFNAWQERPPPGWQEKQDQDWEENSQMHSSHLYSESSSYSKAALGLQWKTRNEKLDHLFEKSKIGNPLRIHEDASSSTLNSKTRHDEKEESGSFSYERGDAIQLDYNSNNNDSFEIVFSSNSKSGKIEPTNGYNKSTNYHERKRANSESSEEIANVTFKSRNLDKSMKFEDSGCADRSQSTDEELLEFRNQYKGEFSPHIPIRPNVLDGLVKTEDEKNANKEPPRLYLFIQMQLCRKETLKDWLNAHTDRDKDEVLDIFDQILSAVQYVHECNLMHRDLKPSNIFFSVDGTVKVGDFGLVTALTKKEGHTPAVVKSYYVNQSNEGIYSRHTDQVGTQLYMSPEQVASHSYSHKVDIYSLGLIFFELLVPFPTQMERGKVMLNVKKQVFPKDFVTNFPEECALVKKLLSHNPLERPSALEIKHHPLLKAFQPQPEIVSRFRRRRTLSQRLSSSGSECDLQPVDALEGKPTSGSV